ncbi:hypothetical protein ACIQSP_16555 [Streptomyces nigra]|uniref:hypothetical protein n=1 Tax=Streptomyces nigra TaxID=1827580 RepID=UPI003819570B
MNHLERQLARLRDQLVILAGARPTPEQLAGEETADKDMARRIHQARPGIPAHHILATLEAFRAVLEMEPGTGPGYCPHCGRGDCAPTADEFEQQRQRAQQLGATLDDVLRHFVHKGHPGEPCLSSGWISEKTVARWRDTSYQPTPEPAAKEATEPGESTLRNLIAAAIYERNNPGHRWADAHPDDLVCYGSDADAAMSVVQPGANITALLARMSEADVQRVIDLYERWVKAGPPPLGTPVSRWWDARLVELHDAILPPIREQRERPTHPDGTPYSYAEITAEGWGFCDGCRMWSTSTPERPHQCADTYNHVAPADQTQEK